jgi:hypothetical protein
MVAPFRMAIPGLAPAGAIIFVRDSAEYEILFACVIGCHERTVVMLNLHRCQEIS